MSITNLKRRNWTVLGVVAVFAAVAAVLTSRDSTARATASPVPQPALPAMAAMKNPSLFVTGVPAFLTRLPADMVPTAGSIRKVADRVGRSGITMYIWQVGVTNTICLASPTVGAGCLDAFRRPFDVSITDVDIVGEGDAVVVSGPVTDEVVDIEVTVGGQVGHATIANNFAYYELADATLHPDAVEKVVARLRDGTRFDLGV